MDAEETVATFMAVCGATNADKVVAFLADLDGNVEMAIESFYELSDAEKAEFGMAEPQHPPPPADDDVDYGAMVEEVVQRKRHWLVEISVFSAHWKLVRGQEHIVAGSSLASNWRLHFSFNDTQFVSHAMQCSSEMAVGESFVAALGQGDFGILLVEVRSLMDVLLGMGGVEISNNGAAAFAGPGGGELAVSGDVITGHVQLRIVLREAVPPPSPSIAALKPRAKKVHRSRSAGDVGNGSSMQRLPMAQPKTVRAVEPLSVECKVCSRSKAYDSIVMPECGHRTDCCRSCFRGVLLRAVESRSIDKLVCSQCGMGYTEHDLGLVLSAAEVDKFRELQLEQFLEQDERIIRCPNGNCKCPMEKMLAHSRDLDQKANGPDGTPLVGVHLRHYNEFRYRCPKCASDFCSSCLALPYHAGYTCTQFKEFVAAKHCRFCKGALGARVVGDVCASEECVGKAALACAKVLKCGHKCAGCKGEQACPPCLDEKCDDPGASFHGGDFCAICYVEDLQSAPCVLLDCGHMFHFSCVEQKVSGKWPGLRITFGFMDCPLCKQRMSNPLLAKVMAPHEELYVKIRSNAVNRLKIDGMLNDDRLVTPGSAYYQKPELYALHSFAYYNCFKCKTPYFGGRRNCEQNQVENRDPSEMVCFDCGDVPKVDCSKPKEHAEFHEWKCRYCCSIAIWFCWGTTHFCEPCHQKAYELKDLPVAKLPKCPGKETCPLKTEHPATGTEFSLGCGICNNDAQQKKGGAKIDAADKGKEEHPGEGPVAMAVPAHPVAAAGALVNGVMNGVVNAVRRSSRVVKKK